ncbi:tRNA uracil 4-sulfurtransferase ThiI [Marinobacter salicampi]|uniref:tRNA uracil 4-sulfurtransferase ThiI n=1 Tax=Marinobacter salicampi TaxID=435907 RepID=UPI0014099F11|nr:tRNA uracil 4-sulfurtransferase ThiI [Marinobacter salicampi]
MRLLIRPAPEVTIKSKPVRQRQMRILRQNIRKILKQLAPGILVDGSFDRVDVSLEDSPGLAESVLDALKRIPGIASIQEIGEFPVMDIDDMAAKALAAYQDRLAGKSFAVRVKRLGDHDFRSDQVARHVGRVLLEQTSARKVELKQPEVAVRIEIRQNRYHIAYHRHPGLGGFPLGSVESVMCLMSGGYDSSVASYLMMRRGMRSHFLFFNLGGAAHEVGVRQVAHHLWQRYGASHSVKFISVPFEGVVAEILHTVDSRHWGVVLKRQMLEAASQIAPQMNATGLVTGDAVAQVSSQTMTNLNVVDQASDQVVLRPLIAMDKGEIIRLATEIGTEPFARTMPEYCGVISRRPVTRARLDRVQAQEQKMDSAVLARAIANLTALPIDQLMSTTVTPEEVELVRTPATEDVIIDLRHPNEQEGAPLELTNNRVMPIPFYELNQAFVSLPADQQYLLYCDQGTMSQLHAGHLRAEGHRNIKVYAPAH